MSILEKMSQYLSKLDKFMTKFDRKIKRKIRVIRGKIFISNGGYKCSFCGSKHINFRVIEGEGYVGESRMLLQFSSDGGIICPLCALDEILHLFNKSKIGNCDFTGKKNVPIINIDTIFASPSKFNLRFGKYWWNGFNASYEAFEQAISNMTMASTYIDINDKTHLYASENRLVPAQTVVEWKSKQDWYI